MNIAFLLAAGKSKRFGQDKLFSSLKNKPVIYHSLKFLEDSPHVSEIFIAVNKFNMNNIKKLIAHEKFRKVKRIVIGGKSRFESVRELAKVLTEKSENLIIHNAANPLVTHAELKQCLIRLKLGKVSGVAPGRQVLSTIKRLYGDSVQQTISRKNLWEMETPQVVRAADFLKVLKRARKGFYTDDLSVLEAFRMKTAVIHASPQNRKITTQVDLEIARIFCGDVPKSFLVGIGEDSHRWKNSKKGPLILGGIKISQLPALEAESDGDVILHAICNALASAIGKGSLGTYATRMAKQGISERTARARRPKRGSGFASPSEGRAHIKDSRKYLQVIQNEMKRQQRSIHNCSISIEAARPKIDPLAPRIKKNLSQLLQIPIERIGITATSGEKLTPFGRGKAIKCQAMVVCARTR